MKSSNFLKAGFLLCSLFLFSCGDEDAATNVQTTKPVEIIDISPNTARVGESIIISGKNFLKEKDSNKVWFAPNIIAAIDLAEETRLFCTVPKGAESGKIIVSTSVNFDTSEVVFKVIEDSTDYPVITSFSPGLGYENTTIVYVNGTNLGTKVTVTMNGGVEFSATVYNNQVSFILPKGAETGKICLKNEKGKVGCSNREFTVLKGIVNGSIAFGGIRAIRNTSEFYQGPTGGPQTSTRTDTISVNNSFKIVRNRVPKSDYFYNIGSCFSANGELPFPDQYLQSFDDKSVSDYPKSYHAYLYKVIQDDIDTVNKIIKKVYFSQLDYYYKDSYAESNYYNSSSKNCNKVEIEITDVPYSLVENKKYIRLSKAAMETHMKYKFRLENSGGRNSYRNSHNENIDGIYEILPDAYFELTLE